MARSYNDILNQIKNSKKEETFVKIGSLKDKPLTNEEFKINAKNTLLTAKQTLNTQKQALNEYLQSQGVVTNNRNLLSSPSALTTQEQRQQILPVTKSNISKIKEEATQEQRQQKGVENLNKYNELTSKGKGAELKENVLKARDEKSIAQYQLNVLEAKEAYDNSGIFGNTLRTIGNTALGVLNLDEKNLVRNQNGDVYDLGSYGDTYQNVLLENTTGIGKYYYSIVGEFTKQAVSAGVNSITFGLGGTGAYYGDIMENQYNSAIAQGYDKQDAFSYAIGDSVIQYLSDKAMGAGPKTYGEGGWLQNVGINHFTSKVIKSSTKRSVANAMLSNFGSEYIQEYLGKIDENIFLKHTNALEGLDSKELREDALFSGIVGLFTGGIGKTAEIIGTSYNIGEGKGLNKIKSGLEKIDTNGQLQANIDNAFKEYESSKGKLSNENKQLIKDIGENYVYLTNDSGNMKVPSSEQLLDIFSTIKSSKLNAIRNKLAKTNNPSQLMEDILRKAEALIFDSNVNLDVVAGQNSQDLTVNPSTDFGPNNTLNINVNDPQTFSRIINNQFAQMANEEQINYIVDYLKSNDMYDNIKQEVINSGQVDGQVDGQVVAKSFGTLLNDEQFLSDLQTNQPELFDNMKDYVNNISYAFDGNTQDDNNITMLNNNLNNNIDNSQQIVNNNGIEGGLLNESKGNSRQTTNNKINSRTIEQDSRKGVKENERIESTNESRTSGRGNESVRILDNQLVLNNNPEEVKNRIDNLKATHKRGAFFDTYELDEIKTFKTFQTKERQTYKSIIESENTSEQEKKFAKELIGSDKYVPTTNQKDLNEAKAFIDSRNPDDVLKTITSDVNNGEKINNKTIAKLENLIQHYLEVGDNERLQEAIQTTAMAGTQLGQSLQAMKMITRLTPQGQVAYMQRVVDKLNKDLKKKNSKYKYDFTPEMQKKILNSTPENKQQILNEVEFELGQQVPMTLGEQLDAWRYFSMLSSPTTHIRNIVGNIAMKYTQRAKNKVKGLIEDLVVKNGEKTATFKSTDKKYKKFAQKDVKDTNVESMLGIGTSKYDEKSGIKANNKVFQSEFLNKTLGKAYDFNSNALEYEDNVFLRSAYQDALSGYLQANNVDINNIDSKILSKARYYAVQEAKRATFHQESNLANTLNALEGQNKVAKVAVGALVPFKKTPINVLKTGLEYNATGLIKTIAFDTFKVRNGSMDINTYIDNLSKGLTGTGIMLVGMTMAQMGLIRTSDDDKEYYEEDKGNQGYSVKIGDKSISLDWISPVGIPFFTGAELYNILSKEENDGTYEENQKNIFQKASDLVNAGVSSLNPLTEMTMLSGLTDVLQSLTYGKTNQIPELLISNTTSTFVNQFTPSILGKITKTLDPYERSTTTTSQDTFEKSIDKVINQFKSKVPILRQTLPVKTDVWGNEVKQQGSNVLTRGINNLLNPATVKDIRTTEVDSEIERLYDATGKKQIIPETSLEKKFTFDGKNYVLTEKEYACYKQIVGKQNLNDINDLISSDAYDSLSDEDKVNAIKNIYGYNKAILEYKYAQSKGIDANISTTYQTAYKVAQAGGNIGDYYTFKASLPDNAKDNDKSKTLKSLDISNIQKSIIYENAIASKDSLVIYGALKQQGIITNINSYLDYQSQKFESDKDSNGNTIKNSKKSKVYEYINNSNLTYEQKLLILGDQYSLSDNEKTILAYMIYNMNLDKEEMLEIYKKLSGFKVNGESITW